jgi:hypothetical protein
MISMNKEEATIKILKVLNSRMAVMSKPMRDEALTLAEEYGINAKDLIEEWTKIAERI